MAKHISEFKPLTHEQHVEAFNKLALLVAARAERELQEEERKAKEQEQECS